MSPGVFVIFLVFATFSLALWVDARWPQLAPKDMWRALLHVGASVLVSPFIVSKGLDIGAHSPATMLLMLVVVVLPALIYCLVAAIWLVKVATSLIGKYRL
jgi:hypothetical protein